MRVLHLNLTDVIGGASRAGYRIHSALREIGIDSIMWVQTRAGDDPTVSEPSDAIGKVSARARLFAETLPPLVHRNRLRPTIFSSALFTDRRIRQIDDLAPDVVHLHWVSGGMISIEALANIGRPIVWTLHDSWAFTGGCHVPYECTRYRDRCGRCPVLGSERELDLSRLVFRRKERIFPRVHFTIVAPSHWLAESAASSRLLHNYPIEVIRNCVDLARFKPIDRQTARLALSLPLDRKLILFGAHRLLDDPNKGFHLLASAMRQLALNWRSRAELIVFGSGPPERAVDFGGLGARYFGHLRDEISLALLYAAADVFVAPSLLENLPNTVVEAMSCGTPSVGFKVGGIPELIEHCVDGYLARPYEDASLAAGIDWVLTQDAAVLRERCRDRATSTFDSRMIANRYRAAYERVLG
jgi:glycosyltransferase involved in cell wall biosynthesis